MAENLLLDSMPAAVRAACLARARPFRISHQAAIPTEDLDGRELYIVTEGVASMMLRSASGRISEMGMMGREGCFPVCALLEIPAKKGIIIAQIGDLAGLRIRSRDFHSIAAPYADAKTLIRKFIYSFMIQMASSMMSSEQDGVERRVARWLLMSHDRIDGDEVPVTHDALAQMAYSHRPTVTNVLRDLKERGIVATSRGHVLVRDRAALRELADGTYGLAEQYWCANIAPFGKDVGPTMGAGGPALRSAAG